MLQVPTVLYSFVALVAVLALPETFATVKVFVDGLYIKSSSYARFVSVVLSENHTCLGAFAVAADADTFAAVPTLNED